MVRPLLPSRHGLFHAGGQLWRAVRQAPQEAQHRQRQNADPCPFVPVVELEPLGREGKPGHIQAQAKNRDQCDGQHPVQQHGGAGVARGRKGLTLMSGVHVCEGGDGCLWR